MSQDAAVKPEIRINFLDIWEHSSDGFRLIDETGIILLVNEPFSRMMGIKKEELEGKHFTCLYSPEYQDEVREIIHGVLHGTGSTLQFEMELVLHNQQKKYFDISNYILQSDNKRQLLTVFRDITAKKSAEERLKDSYDYLNRILDCLSIPVFVKDSGHRFVHVNKAFCEFTKFSRAELICKNDYDFFPPEQAKVFVQYDQHVLDTGETFINEEEITQSDGSLHTIVTRKTVLTDKAGDRFIAGSIQDITNLKRAAAEMQLFRALIDQSNDAIEIIDVESSYFIDGNKKAWQDLGYTKEEFLSLKYYDVGVFDDNTYSSVAGNLQHSGYALFEGFHVRKDGSRYPVEVSIKLIYSEKKYIAMVRDITARKNAEKAVLDAKEELSTTIKALAEGVISTDLKGNIKLVNKAAEDIFEFPQEELLGKSIVDLLRTVSEERLRNSLSIEDITNKSLFEELYSKHVFTNPLSGNKKIISGRYSEIKDRVDVLKGRVFVLKDITTEVEIENRLTLSQKMESIGNLAAGIAHEINTPMQYIGNNTSFLKDAFCSLKDYIDYLNLKIKELRSTLQPEDFIAEVSAKETECDIQYLKGEVLTAIEQSQVGISHVNKIVLAMKDFAHPNTKEKSLYNLNRGIEVTVEISKNTWKYWASVDVNLDSGAPLVNCVQDEINQVLLNIIVNAAHAIQEKIEHNLSEEKGIITISSSHDENYVLLEISDNGAGIEEKNRTKIFDPFFTTKEVGHGTGQGLSIAHDIIVNKHGGTIWMETIWGTGTTFYIKLPVE